MRWIDLCKTALNEGLVKVPAKLERSVLRLVNMHLLWMLRDKAGKTYPEHRQAVTAFARSIGESLPKTKWVKPANNFAVIELPLDVSDLPSNYAKLIAKHQKIFIVLDYGHLKVSEDTGAYYWHRTNKAGATESLLVIHMEKLRGVRDFPAHRAPEEVPYIINVIADIIRHELQHMIQYVLLAPVDKTQIAQLPDYRQHKADYYASPVEFDPQIGSAVADFVEHWQIMIGYQSKGQLRGKLSLSKSIKQFVGMLPGSIGNGFNVAPLFQTLHRSDPSRYRTAVKKFVVGVTDRLRTAAPPAP